MHIDQIRNFSIIAHIDHGKTTLTDQFLQHTETISEREFKVRLLDSNPIEQERGITIKLAPVRMLFQAATGTDYQLNLIDTPGHVDFGYEVSRSLAATEGALLLIDATQGVQAQTVSNYFKARELGLTIIPVLNKIDLPAADPELIGLEVMETLDWPDAEFSFISAKTGQGVPELLERIVTTVPAPVSTEDQLQGLIFSSVFDQHLGIVAYVRVVSGQLNATQLQLMATKLRFKPVEIGIFNPRRQPVESLNTGEVGYIATGLKQPELVKVGDTITHASGGASQPLAGYQEPQSMVFVDLFPVAADDLSQLEDALHKLHLHDSSFTYNATHSMALGNGYHMGFLGVLHAEVVQERLKREFGLQVIASAPGVSYQLRLKSGKTVVIESAHDWPDPSIIAGIQEPVVAADVFVPAEYYGAIIQLLPDFRAELLSTTLLGKRYRLQLRLPLAELMLGLFDRLKSVTAGYASLEYRLAGWQPVQAVKLSVLVNHEEVPALAQIVVEDRVQERARGLVSQLKEVIPRQLFEIPVQGAVGGTIVARETIKAYRKDVTAKLYGGDRTRRMKLLQKQAKGKKRMEASGKVELPPEVFLSVLRK